MTVPIASVNRRGLSEWAPSLVSKNFSIVFGGTCIASYRRFPGKDVLKDTEAFDDIRYFEGLKDIGRYLKHASWRILPWKRQDRQNYQMRYTKV